MLRDVRKEKNISRKALAEMTGIAETAIRDYEQGHRDINGAAAIKVYRIAQALDCKIEDILNV